MPSWTWLPHPEVIFNVRDQIIPEWYELVFDINNICAWSVVHTARNNIVRKFLDSWCDYLRWCDDDNPPSTDVLKYLIDADKDVCSALVPLRHWAYMLNIFDKWKNVTSIKDYDNLFEVENIWTWCVLLKRDVVKDVYMETKWIPYQFRVIDFVWNTDTNSKEIYTNQDTIDWWEKHYVSTDWKINKLQWEIWEDLFFGNVAKQLWYKFYADKRARCKHYKNKPEALFVQNI